jgi:hypothetical protein
MRVCAGIKRDGGRCAVAVAPGQTYCYQHDPGRQDERQRNAARGGRAKGSRQTQRLMSQLEDIKERTLSGDIEHDSARVFIAATRAQTALLELARKIVEQEELLERIEALEVDSHEQRGGYRTWAR